MDIETKFKALIKPYRQTGLVLIPKKVVDEIKVYKGQYVEIQIKETKVGMYTTWKKIGQIGGSLMIPFNRIDIDAAGLEVGQFITIKIRR